MDGEIKRVLGDVDSGRECNIIRHLLRPYLVGTNRAFRQPYGSEERAGAIQLRKSPRRLRMGTIRRQPPGSGWPPRAGRSFRNEGNLAQAPTTRVGWEPAPYPTVAYRRRLAPANPAKAIPRSPRLPGSGAPTGAPDGPWYGSSDPPPAREIDISCR